MSGLPDVDACITGSLLVTINLTHENKERTKTTRMHLPRTVRVYSEKIDVATLDWTKT
jgi:hypothetical protein